MWNFSAFVTKMSFSNLMTLSCDKVLKKYVKDYLKERLSPSKKNILFLSMKGL